MIEKLNRAQSALGPDLLNFFPRFCGMDHQDHVVQLFNLLTDCQELVLGYRDKALNEDAHFHLRGAIVLIDSNEIIIEGCI